MNAPECYYEIRVRGHLNPRRARWFDGMTITLLENGDTLISGTIPDQAALHGLLNRIRDLGLPLIGVNQKEE